MRAENKHMIEQQFIEVNFQVIEDAMNVQNQLADIFYERIQPRMEELFNEVCGADQIISVDKLEIDCGVIKAKHWEEEWVDAVLFQLRQQLSSLQKKRIERNHYNELFFHFLQGGNLPWNFSIESTAELEGLIHLDELFLKKLKAVLFRSDNSFKRLEQQFSYPFVLRLIQGLRKYELQFFHELDADEMILKQDSMKNVLISVLKAWTQFKPAADDQLKRNAVEDTPAGDLKEINLTSDDTIYIHNAGLVLLHPFLSTFFEELNLVKDNSWIGEDAQASAALVLQLIADDRTEFAEFNLPLNKILCGLEPAAVLNGEASFGAEATVAIDEMLLAVIAHWKVLKNTSVEGFREAFLQREGKLTRRTDNWLLKVETKAIDVLLRQLPWGIGFIRLPWMDIPLHVEWS
jgi:hypothetical protein